MTEKIRNEIKEIIEENSKSKDEKAIKSIYNDAWKFVLIQFKRNYNKTDCCLLPKLFFEKYKTSTEEENINETIKLLKNDGFKEITNTNLQAFEISCKDIANFANYNSSNKPSKMPITPFAETRKRK